MSILCYTILCNIFLINCIKEVSNIKNIYETKNCFGIIYEVYIDCNLIKKVSFIRINKRYKDFNYLFLLDSNGVVIDDVYKFINIKYKHKSLNTREQLLSFLKLLYSFSSIINKDFRLFDSKDIELFSSFILGESIEGNFLSLNLITERSISTHNQYFNNMRSFFKFLGIHNEYVFDKVVVEFKKEGFGIFSHAKTVSKYRFKTNKTKHSSYTLFIPSYISLENYHVIINFIDNQNISNTLKLRNKLIVELMYSLGLRIGEVLGLTVEDLINHPNDNNSYEIILRNRLSDKPYQKAKTAYKVTSKNDYLKNFYQEEHIGYQKVIAPPRIKCLIDNYFNISRNVLFNSDKKIYNISTFSNADCVNPTNKSNSYIFLNKDGKPLNYSGWNKELKRIFKNVGINIDVNSKKNNLNHRFRHGYAMFLLKNNYSIAEIKVLMRHTNLSSTLIYLRHNKIDVLESTKKLDTLRFSKETEA